jgi:hypothetical protein
VQRETIEMAFNLTGLVGCVWLKIGHSDHSEEQQCGEEFPQQLSDCQLHKKSSLRF